MRNNPERDKAILKDVLNGYTLSAVSKTMGLSIERIRQIVYSLCREAKCRLAFHFNREEWENTLPFFRKHKDFIFKSLRMR